MSDQDHARTLREMAVTSRIRDVVERNADDSMEGVTRGQFFLNQAAACLAGAAALARTCGTCHLRERLTLFVERERALIDAKGKGGQSVGYSPSITPSVCAELERMLRDIVHQPQEPSR
jgi:hypothetical protein